MNFLPKNFMRGLTKYMKMVVKRKKRKIGSSYTTMRKIGGKRKKVRVTKKSGGKISVRVIVAKRRRK